MIPEWISAFAAVGTLIVISATALAAVVQLRHIRSANQLTGLLQFTETFEGDVIQGATSFITRQLSEKLRDEEFVKGLLETNTDRREHPELRVCDFLEQQGSYIKFEMIDREQYIDLIGAYVTSMWDALREVVALRRVARDDARMYENFEYLASLTLHMKGADRRSNPRGVPVLMREDAWRRLAQNAIAAASSPRNME